MSTMNNDHLFVDLNDIAIAEVETLVQEGSRGMAELAASCGTNCNVATACSCTIDNGNTISPIS
jgi:hypothetical protein